MIERKEQKREDTWDLEKIYKTSDEWMNDLNTLKDEISNIKSIKGKLSESSDSLYSALSTLKEIMMRTERLMTYAFLEYSVDSSNADVQLRAALGSNAESLLSEKLSFFDPEFLSLSDDFIDSCLKEERFDEFSVYIKKSRRLKEHVLSESEERILSLYSPLSNAFEDVFMDMENIDMKFNSVFGEELTHSSYIVFLHSLDERVRKEAYYNYYKAFDEHKNTIAKTYIGSVKNDVFISKARKYQSSLSMALFGDNVSESVYTSLIESVHAAFPSLHRYYKLRAKKMGKDKIHHYDVYMPLIENPYGKISYEEGVEIIGKAVEPLGEKYKDTLLNGLLNDRWVDRYENIGKRSGAFSSGSYDTMPYILTNYKDEAIDSVFTLIHEGGHSMHSYYSKKNNPYMSHNYTIFEAEVASTFNENLLHNYLYREAKSNDERVFLLSKRMDDIVATLFRQTMFSEFELLIHRSYESGEPLTLDTIRATYKGLLDSYFGESVIIDGIASLEALRVPHFYNAFYCYKYATGLSASIALSERVLNGGEKERGQYLGFLKSGGSLYPIESLKRAGVDMSTPIPVQEATKVFDRLLDEFEAIAL